MHPKRQHFDTRKILLIEDDPDDYILIRDMLAEAKTGVYEIDWAQSITQGIEKIKDSTFDICLVDYRLGSDNGLDFLGFTQHSNINTPIILITGQNEIDIDLAALHEGADYFLNKGDFSAKTLERSIRYTIQRTQKLNQVTELAIRDPLTKVFNRLKFDELIEDTFQAAHKHETPLSLAIIDIDYFKTINDTYGHLSGDHVLKQIANVFPKNIRKSDYFSRIGGDEFAIIMPKTTKNNAFHTVDRIRKLVNEIPIPVEKDNKEIIISISLSIGIADNSDTIDTPTKLFEATDKSLYSAKQTGRNQVVIFTNP